MTLGALALVWGFVIWQWGDPFTAIYTRYQQRELGSQLAAVETRYSASTRAASGTAAGPDTSKAAGALVRRDARRLRDETATGNALGRIRISRLGLDMVFVDGTDSGSLTKGPGFDQRTHLPGEGQLVYIAGHRTTYAAPFAHIDRLRNGDRVDLEMPYGTFAYRVVSHVIVAGTDIGRLRSRGREEVALQACHPRFSARERYIVYAQPISGTS